MFVRGDPGQITPHAGDIAMLDECDELILDGTRDQACIEFHIAAKPFRQHLVDVRHHQVGNDPRGQQERHYQP